MIHYINKDALVLEIENLRDNFKKCLTHNSYEEGLKDGRLIGYEDALYKINTLEAKEEDKLADTFIKKACDWFRTLDDKEPPYKTTEEFIEGFKKAMKGE